MEEQSFRPIEQLTVTHSTLESRTGDDSPERVCQTHCQVMIPSDFSKDLSCFLRSQSSLMSESFARRISCRISWKVPDS